MNQQQLIEEIENILRAPKGSLAPDAQLDSIHWDSMATIEFQAVVDEKFGLTISPEDVSECKSVGELCAAVIGLYEAGSAS